MTGLPPLPPSVHKARAAVRRAMESALLAESGEEDFHFDDGFQHASKADLDRQLLTLVEPEPEPLFLVALSGGTDSLALAAAAAHVAPKLGMRAGAVIVDHGLQEGSNRVAHRAADAATELGLDPVRVFRVVVCEQGSGLEAAAREARYHTFDTASSELGARWVLTAHTRDDQAEQVLLGLSRGSGTRSLAGIPPQRGMILRPFLAISREETRSVCEHYGLEPWQDPHNDNPTFQRVRVRRRVLPNLIEELGPHLPEQLARTAALARADADALDSLANDSYWRIAHRVQGVTRISVSELEGLLPAIRTRVLKRAAEQVGGRALSLTHITELERLVTHWRGQGEINVPGAVVWRDGHTVCVRALTSVK